MKDIRFSAIVSLRPHFLLLILKLRQVSLILCLLNKLVVLGYLLIIYLDPVFRSLSWCSIISAKGFNSSIVNFCQSIAHSLGANHSALIVQTSGIISILISTDHLGMYLLFLKVAINSGLAALGKARLCSEVVVSKVMAIACWDEGESERVVWRGSAAIRRPVQAWRVTGIPTRSKLR